MARISVCLFWSRKFYLSSKNFLWSDRTPALRGTADVDLELQRIEVNFRHTHTLTNTHKPAPQLDVILKCNGFEGAYFYLCNLKFSRLYLDECNPEFFSPVVLGGLLYCFGTASARDWADDGQKIYSKSHISHFIYVNSSKCEWNISLQLCPLFSNNISNANVTPRNLFLEQSWPHSQNSDEVLQNKK